VNVLEWLERFSRPWNQAALLLLLGTLWLLVRRVRVAAVLLLAGVLWLGLCSTPAFALWLQRGLTGQYPVAVAEDYPRADAIVVLGGGMVPRPDTDWDSELADTEATRVGFGLQLFRAGRAGRLLLSGGRRAALHMEQSLRAQGVPEQAMLTESASDTTHQNALYSAAILERHGWRRILLVTSPLHMPRAAAAFRRQGLTVIPAPSIGHDRPGRPLQSSWRPQRRALLLSSRCLHEYFGLWIYQLRGWA
jgi:uncharacterized SAM-binding protein YcdF (DUF218 family)